MAIELINIDCMAYMATLPDKAFELAIVDPPYRDKNDPTEDMRNNGSMISIKGKPSPKYFDELKRISKNQIIWGANNFQLSQFMGFVVWDKVMPQNFTMSMAEIASLSEGLGTISKIFKLRISQLEDRIHPTQKPVALYRWLLHNYAKPGDRILDTHLGSGSSAIAAHQMGFDFVGCELDSEYHASAVKRFKEQTAQQTLFK